jgi:hypothetical protein
MVLKKALLNQLELLRALEKEAVDLDKKLKAATTVPKLLTNAKLAQTKSAISQLKKLELP